MTRKKKTQAKVIYTEVCECGERLPTHLLFALSSHTCSCGAHFKIDNARTEQARFRRDGERHNPFV